MGQGNVVREFEKEDMLAMLDATSGKYYRIRESIQDHSRWSVQYDVIFQDKENGKHYRTYYSVGATEYQYEGPWDYEDVVKAFEVTPVERLTIVYEYVKEPEQGE